MNKLLLCLFVFTQLISISYAQTFTPARELKAAQVPASIRFTGKLLQAWQWKDKTGNNLLVLSGRDVFDDKIIEEEQTRAASIHAYQWVKTDTGYQQVWKLMDFIAECPFDVTLRFFLKGTQITDLDKDGVAEVTLVYKMSCRSDVSPDEMKVIMREGAQKYALRGLMCDPANGPQKKPCVAANSLNLEKLPRPADEYEQYTQAIGRYQSEKDFAQAPPAFLIFARQQWLRFVTSFD